MTTRGEVAMLAAMIFVILAGDIRGGDLMTVNKQLTAIRGVDELSRMAGHGSRCQHSRRAGKQSA